ncbi:MAG: hypothetical protein AAF602_11710 [Myxococcota bacterium]
MNLRLIAEYQIMMADEVRMRAYQAAIRRHCAGRTVCEVGVGLGPLSLMALEAGATRVYGIEAIEPVLHTTTSILRSLGYDERRFVPLHGMSYAIELPERVDVVISETLDSIGLGENTVAAMGDAARRFLKPGGTLLPSHLGCAAALAAPESYAAPLSFWRETMPARHGLDYSGLADAIGRVDQTLTVEPHEVHSEWTVWQEVDLADVRSFRDRTGFVLEVQRPGRITGIATAFVAAIGDQLLNTFPGQAGTHWKQGFLPLPRPVDAQPGDLVAVSVTLPNQRELTVSLQKRFVHVPASQAAAFRSRLPQPAPA